LPAPPVSAEEPLAEAPAGAEDDTVRYYRNLTLSDEAAAYVPPETVELGVFRDAVFTEEEIDGVLRRLLDAGWEDMTADNYEGVALYFSQPELDPPPLEEIIAEKQSGAAHTVTERDEELARRFVADGGLDALIYEKTGVSLVTEADMSLSYVLFSGYYNGIRTDTYVRMNFYGDGRLAEAKVYAVIPDTRPVPALPVPEAMKNAFTLTLYNGGDDLTPLTVTAVRLEYIRGLPYYIFTTDEMFGTRPLEVRALAVDRELIDGDDALRAQYERMVDDFP